MILKIFGNVNKEQKQEVEQTSRKILPKNLKI